MKVDKPGGSDGFNGSGQEQPFSSHQSSRRNHHSDKRNWNSHSNLVNNGQSFNSHHHYQHQPQHYQEQRTGFEGQHANMGAPKDYLSSNQHKFKGANFHPYPFYNNSRFQDKMAFEKNRFQGNNQGYQHPKSMPNQYRYPSHEFSPSHHNKNNHNLSFDGSYRVFNQKGRDHFYDNNPSGKRPFVRKNESYGSGQVKSSVKQYNDSRLWSDDRLDEVSVETIELSHLPANPAAIDGLDAKSSKLIPSTPKPFDSSSRSSLLIPCSPGGLPMPATDSAILVKDEGGSDELEGDSLFQLLSKKTWFDNRKPPNPHSNAAAFESNATIPSPANNLLKKLSQRNKANLLNPNNPHYEPRLIALKAKSSDPRFPFCLFDHPPGRSNQSIIVTNFPSPKLNELREILSRHSPDWNIMPRVVFFKWAKSLFTGVVYMEFDSLISADRAIKILDGFVINGCSTDNSGIGNTFRPDDSSSAPSPSCNPLHELRCSFVHNFQGKNPFEMDIFDLLPLLKSHCNQ